LQILAAREIRQEDNDGAFTSPSPIFLRSPASPAGEPPSRTAYCFPHEIRGGRGDRYERRDSPSGVGGSPTVQGAHYYRRYAGQEELALREEKRAVRSEPKEVVSPQNNFEKWRGEVAVELGIDETKKRSKGPQDRAQRYRDPMAILTSPLLTQMKLGSWKGIPDGRPQPSRSPKNSSKKKKSPKPEWRRAASASAQRSPSTECTGFRRSDSVREAPLSPYDKFRSEAGGLSACPSWFGSGVQNPTSPGRSLPLREQGLHTLDSERQKRGRQNARESGDGPGGDSGAGGGIQASIHEEALLPSLEEEKEKEEDVGSSFGHVYYSAGLMDRMRETNGVSSQELDEKLQKISAQEEVDVIDLLYARQTRQRPKTGVERVSSSAEAEMNEWKVKAASITGRAHHLKPFHVRLNKVLKALGGWRLLEAYRHCQQVPGALDPTSIGWLHRDQFLVGMSSLVEDATRAELAMVWDDLDEDKDGYIDMHTFEQLRWHDQARPEMQPAETASSALFNIQDKYKRNFMLMAGKKGTNVNAMLEKYPQLKAEYELRGELKKYTHGKQRPMGMVKYQEFLSGRHMTTGERLSAQILQNREKSRHKGKTLHSIQVTSRSEKRSGEEEEGIHGKPETVPLHALKNLFALEGIKVNGRTISKAMEAFKKVVPTGTQMDMNSFDKVLPRATPAFLVLLLPLSPVGSLTEVCCLCPRSWRRLESRIESHQAESFGLLTRSVSLLALSSSLSI